MLEDKTEEKCRNRHGRNIVAPPGNQEANRENKPQPKSGNDGDEGWNTIVRYNNQNSRVYESSKFFRKQEVVTERFSKSGRRTIHAKEAKWKNYIYSII